MNASEIDTVEPLQTGAAVTAGVYFIVGPDGTALMRALTFFTCHLSLPLPEASKRMPSVAREAGTESHPSEARQFNLKRCWQRSPIML